jgi:hypothetical protein
VKETLIRNHGGVVFLAVVVAGFTPLDATAEVIFQDVFTSPAGNITNRVRWINVEGNGWQTGVGQSQLALDGGGNL